MKFNQDNYSINATSYKVDLSNGTVNQKIGGC
jgi:hypothetical protein